MNYASNRIYLLLTIIVGILTYSLNLFNKITECSLVFIFLAFALNVIAEIFGKEKAIITIALSVFSSLALMLDYNYYIGGRVITGLIPASLIAVLASAYVGIYFLLRFKNTNSVYSNFYARGFVSLISYSVVDGLVMAMFFINKQFALNKVLLIFYKEMLFKFEYALIVTMALYILHKAYLKYIEVS